MKRFKYVLPILAVMMAVVVAFAFRQPHTPSTPSKPAFADNEYFQFLQGNGLASGTEAQYIDAASWAYIGTVVPGTSPCTDGPNDYCVVGVNAADAGILPADNAATRESKFADYMANLGGTNPASTYLAMHFYYKKP